MGRGGGGLMIGVEVWVVIGEDMMLVGSPKQLLYTFLPYYQHHHRTDHEDDVGSKRVFSKQVPPQWREWLIVNLFKKGDKEDPGNYRGITLLRKGFL